VICLGSIVNRQGDDCDRCKKNKSEVGPVDYYPEYKHLFCTTCKDEADKEKNAKCQECGKAVGIAHLSSSDGKNICHPCVLKKEKKRKKNEKIKTFVISNWKFWIILTTAIIGLVITYFGLSG